MTKEPSQAETAQIIADLLGETEPAPRAAILSHVKTLGRTQAWRIASWATQCHDAHGGLAMGNGQKMKKGSLFLHYANAYGVPKQRRFRERQSK